MSRRAAFSQADLSRALAAAKKHGLTVAGYEIAPDGTIRVLTSDGGTPLPSADQDEDAWKRGMARWRRSA